MRFAVNFKCVIIIHCFSLYTFECLNARKNVKMNNHKKKSQRFKNKYMQMVIKLEIVIANTSQAEELIDECEYWD